MHIIEKLTYAGLGLAAEASDKAKSKFEELVEVGKKQDADRKNCIEDFFKSAESTKHDLSDKFNKGKEKLEDRFPMLKDLENQFTKVSSYAAEKLHSVKNEIREKANKAKEEFTSESTNSNDVEEDKEDFEE